MTSANKNGIMVFMGVRFQYFVCFWAVCCVFSMLTLESALAQYRQEPKPQITVNVAPEPTFKPVKFLKLDPPITLRERVERLTHGMVVDLPPEYDYYGHDIRRFMAKVGNPAVLDNPKNIKGQLQNIKVAQKISADWQAAHFKETKEIERIIDETNASSSIRSLYKTQKGAAEAFFIELNSWIKNNRDSLAYLLEIGPKAYQYQEGKFRFRGQTEFKKYDALHDSRLRALEQMHGYTPFRLMVY